MKQEILNLIRELDEVSLVELRNLIPGFRGNEIVCINDNIVIWNNVSLDAINALNDLKEAGLIIMNKCGPRLYLVDGICLDLPLATEVHEKYKELHWLPVVFCIGGQHVH